MRILTASDHALLVETADLAEAMRRGPAWARVPGVVELVPGARSVLVRFDPLQVSAGELAAALVETTADAADLRPAGPATIPVRYDGEDLHSVAALLGVSVDEVVSRHLGAGWQVAFSGFAPGFGYLVGDDPLFDVPRRPSPRTRVPAGAVALAGAFTGVYPRESPGGWQLIGRTDAVMWDIDREPPALLSPGTRVRFVRESREVLDAAREPWPAATGFADPGPQAPETPAAVEQWSDRAAGGRTGLPGSAPPIVSTGSRIQDAAIDVVHAGLQLLVQDLGRAGHAALGVSASGAADRTALRDANRAVGNDRGAAVLENVGGTALRMRGGAVLAVTGAIGELVVVDAAGAERVVSHGIPFAMADGEELELAPPTHGLRYTIAVRGGVAAPLVLGSRATDTLADLGPAPLVAGDVIGIGAATGLAVDPSPLPRPLPASGDLVELDITLGPRDDWFTPQALHALIHQEWTVTPRSDRVGIRLHGEVALARAVEGELPSEGAVTGAIQVPADGQPVLFLPDHPLTGGYPIIGALAAGALDLAGQLAPGVRIRFRAARR